MVSFSDRVAIITGASSGIGKAISLSLAKSGATVCLTGRSMQTLEQVAGQVRSPASRTVCYKADLSLDSDIQGFVASILKDFREVDILVHSAGFFSLGQTESASLEDWDQHLRINVRAPYAITKALLPLLKIRKGQIVFINSTVAFMNGRAKLGQYTATKHALKAFADSLREEVNASGIRVISVYPGRTATPMQVRIHAMEGKTYEPQELMQPEDVAQMVISALGLPRSAEVTDIIMRPMMKNT